jgi:hypothetical protein
MSIQVIQQPGSISFAGDPIIVKARTTLSGKTFLRIRMSCDVKAYRDSEQYAYSEDYAYEVGSDGYATFNVSSTIQTALNRCIVQQESGNAVTQTMFSAQFTLTYRETFLEEGVEIEESRLTSSEYKAIPGALTEFERFSASSADTSSILGSGRILSRKPAGEAVPFGTELYLPVVSTTSGTVSYQLDCGDVHKDLSMYTGGTLVPASIRIDTSSLPMAELKVSFGFESAPVKYTVPRRPDMRDFIFINRFGLAESVTAVMRESLEYAVESNTYVVPSDINFRARTQTVNYASSPQASYGMSSGYVSREWAEWWVNEFTVCRKAWMVENGSLIPVAIIPEESLTLYDRTKPSLIAVNFTVRFSFTGGTFNSFVR